MNHFLEISINGYKIIKNFSLIFPEKISCICLTGEEGTGKTTILQAIDFIAAIFRGDVSEWMDKNNFNNKDVTFNNNKNIDFKVSTVVDSQNIVWDAIYNINKRKCIKECFFIDNIEVFSIKNNIISFEKKKERNIFSYEGSFLKKLNDSTLNEICLLSFLKFMEKIHTCYSPNINELIEPYNEKNNKGMQSLAKDFALLSSLQKKNLLYYLRRFYPEIIDLKIIKDKTHFNLFITKIDKYDVKIIIPLYNINESCVKIIKFLIEYIKSESLITFDNIEFWIPFHLFNTFIHFIEFEKKNILITTYDNEYNIGHTISLNENKKDYVDGKK